MLFQPQRFECGGVVRKFYILSRAPPRVHELTKTLDKQQGHVVTELWFGAEDQMQSARLAGAPTGDERAALWAELEDLLVNFDKNHPSGGDCG
jgi:hypothetical protein